MEFLFTVSEINLLKKAFTHSCYHTDNPGINPVLLPIQLFIKIILLTYRFI